MEFREILRRRRMVRHYTGNPVDAEALERILRSVRRAPSAGFSQGQRLVVVTERPRREAIAKLLGEGDTVAEGLEPWLSSAPVHVVVCTREDDYHDRYRQQDKLDDRGREIEWPVPYWFVDAGALVSLLHLAALDEALAAGVFGVPGEAMEPFNRLLGIPPDVAVVCVLTVGRPGAESGPDRSSRATRPRKPLGELVRWERWS